MFHLMGYDHMRDQDRERMRAMEEKALGSAGVSRVTDEELIALTVQCARIYFGAFPFMALQMTGQSTFVALNYPRHALFFSLLRKVGLVAPLTLLLPGLGLGANGVFWAELISQLTGATACFLTMYHVIWKRMMHPELLKEVP